MMGVLASALVSGFGRRQRVRRVRLAVVAVVTVIGGLAVSACASEGVQERGGAPADIAAANTGGDDSSAGAGLDRILASIVVNLDRPPRFESFPVDTGGLTPGEQLDPDTQGGSPEVREALRAAAAKGPDFAGHFAVVRVPCGPMCEHVFILDAQSGRVYDGIEAPPTLRYRLDSRLLVIDTPPASPGQRRCSGCTAAYYEWTGYRLELIGPELWAGSLPAPPFLQQWITDVRTAEWPAIATAGDTVIRPTWDRLVFASRSGTRRTLTDERAGDNVRTVHIFRGSIPGRGHLVEIVTPAGSSFGVYSVSRSDAPGPAS